MSSLTVNDRVTALTSALGYANMRMGELIANYQAPEQSLGDRTEIARLAHDALNRYVRLTDATPGGFSAAQTAMTGYTNPIDEFIAMTTPRSDVQAGLRLMALSSWEIELVNKLDEPYGEVVAVDAGLWRRVEAGEKVVRETELDDLGRSAASVYARRLLGEAAVMSQRLVVRQPAFREVLAGGEDEDITTSTQLLDDVLSAVARRVNATGVAA